MLQCIVLFHAHYAELGGAYICSDTSFLTVGPPEIICHPENQSVVTGEDTDFSIQATGDNLQFQWQKDGSDLSESGKYCGTNTDTLHIIKMEEDDKGDYRCIVKNDVEMKFSDEALLTVSKLVNADYASGF